MEQIRLIISFLNDRFEVCFSQLKNVRSGKRCSLGKDKLGNLVCIGLEEPCVNKWNVTNAVKIWWMGKREPFKHKHQEFKRVRVRHLKKQIVHVLGVKNCL